jgi:uncharacterized metal-binding protein
MTAHNKPVLIIPCSGIGKVHGLISREAAYLVTDELSPGLTDAICLALLVKGDAEAFEAVKTQPCIAIDGCPKACVEKNLQIAGGRAARVIQVSEVLKMHRGAKPGSPTELTDEGWAIVREIASTVSDAAAQMHSSEDQTR